MTDIPTFLAHAVPWPSSERPGYVNVHFQGTHQATGKPMWPGRAYTSHDTASWMARWWGRREGSDTFVCMSLQSNAEAKVSAKGKRIMRAVRAAEYALFLQSFWLDVDIKDGFFRDTNHALDELGLWRRRVGLPAPSMIVGTGSGGFHAHWIVDEPLARDDWYPLARSLQQAVVAENFSPAPDPATGAPRILDLNVIVNPACLLRIPGTFNHKTGVPRPASLLHFGVKYPLALIAAPLSKYPSTYAPRVSAPQSTRLNIGKPSALFAGIALGVSLAAGLDETSWQPTIQEVAAGCPWIARTLKEHGTSQREPLWFEALKVAYYAKDGAQVAHDLSSGHAGYDRDLTDAKFQTIEHTHGSGRVGWPQCRTVHAAGAAECTACPHLAKGKSPLNFALIVPPPAVAPAAPAAIPLSTRTYTLPHNYFWDNERRIYTKVPVDPKDPNSPLKNELVSAYPIFDIVPQSINEETGFGYYALNFKVEVAHNKVVQMQVKHRDASDKFHFAKIVSDQGLFSKNTEPLRVMMASFTEQLRTSRQEYVASEPYGWSIVDGEEQAFVYNRRRFNGANVVAVIPVDPKLGECYKATGSLDYWKQIARLITDQQRPDLNAIVAAAAAAPLVQMTGHNGFIMSAYSPDTALQKSAAMRVGQSFWGHPVSGMGGLNDTPNFVNQRMTALKNLPYFLDEIKFTKDFGRLTDMIFDITQGKSRGKLTRASVAFDVGSFNTLMVTASNGSLVDHITGGNRTTTAGAMRILEYQVARNRNGTGMIEGTKAQSLIGDLGKNYGVAGNVYAEFLGSNVKIVRDTVNRNHEAVNTAVKGTSEERFWIANAATVLTGAKFINDLGLTNINLDQLTGFFVDQILRSRDAMKVSPSDISKGPNVERFVADYFNARRNQTLHTEAMWTAPARPPAGWNARPLGNPMQDLRGNIVIHLSSGANAHYPQRLLRISEKDFADWLQSRNIQRTLIFKAIKDTMPSTFGKKVALGIGTSFKTARETIIEFDLSQMPGFFD